MIDILKRIKYILFGSKINKKQPVKYRIGNVKHHNSLIDTLLPQFVTIGDNFISAPGSIILAHDASLFLFSKEYRCEETIIGNNVFLGANAVVLPGVTIGDGAIIGAGSVVTKNVSPDSVYAGNPAKFICTVEQYREKCYVKDVLYKAPESFNSLFNGKNIGGQSIEEFQSQVQEMNIKKKRKKIL